MTIRTLVFGASLAFVASCASDATSKLCPTTNIVCPADTICAAAQPVCLRSACGNGTEDVGEECDDGNVLSGDGCSPTCRDEVCGNNVEDPGEACDDGNEVSGDGCAADCLSDEVCGNKIPNVGEQCDDMNSDNTDACVNCRDAICGDGYVRAGLEECDGDGNGNPEVAGDNCSPSCQLEGCHNGRLDPGEGCDDNNTDDTDACVLDCKIAVCGDGVIRTGVEQCDGDVDTTGDGIPEDTCSDTCRFVGCGNGISDPGEQCDDGCLSGMPGVCEPSDNGDGCSSLCTFENCGNGVRDAGEDCDGNNMGMGGLTADCNIDCTNSVCGDGKRNTIDEACDNGTDNGPTKNCTDSCAVNFCGDGKVDGQAPGIEACDEGPGMNLDDGMGCSSTCQLEGCGNGVINTGEQCEDSNMSTTDGCVNCQLARCGDGFLQAGVEQCDGSTGVKPVPTATCGAPASVQACRWQYCGNGHLDGSEQCDDNNNTNGDGCTAGCLREVCGDGIDNNGSAEQCDGNGTGTGGQTPTCNTNCTTARCGDGLVNTNHIAAGGSAVEQCDDGGVLPNDGCSANCQFERCGNNTVDPGEQCDGTAGTKPVGQPGATCGVTGVTACRWIYCGNSILDSGEQCDNGAANANTAACKANCTINTCGDGFQLAGIEGCDAGTANNGPTRDCTGACQPNICGDGFPHTAGAATEQCDDGNPLNNDACTTTCRLPTCGDGEVNGTEVCDFGVGNNTAAKPAACPYGQASCAQCSAGCTALGAATGPYCGDGTCANGETAATCNIDCDVPMCGDGEIEGTELCDYGPGDNDGVQCENGNPPAYGFGNACVACTSSCMTVISAEYCGDGSLDAPDEQCDGALLGGATCASIGQGTGTLTCGSSCSFNTSACTGPSFTLTAVKAGTGTGTITSNTGGISCPGTCSASYTGSPMVILTATPTGGSVFTGWSGACTNPSGTCTVTMSQARSVTATFAPTFALTVTPAGTGSGVVTSNVGGISCPGTCSANYASGMVTLTATPDGADTFVWSGDCTGSATCIVTMSAARNVTVTYTDVP